MMTSSPSSIEVPHSWAEKYKPKTIAQMCYPVTANKLKQWMEEFEANSSKMRGALLSGPPGVGKTTSVYVVASELGRVVVEYNASDFRSRKSLRENVSTVVNNRTFSNTSSSYANIVLLMDEVDGCDIGGVGEVIQMIKNTNVPIICTCNDRWHPKLRSLLNHVEDIRAGRPPCNIVANYLCDKVLAREGISLSKQLLQDIIQRSGSDIRSMLNNLQMWCINQTSLQQKKLAECALQSAKDGDVGLFEAAEVFLLQGSSRGRPRSIEELQSTFYNSDLVDMFVQENYLHFKPEDRDWMDAVAEAASSISLSDLAQRIMFFENNWSVSRSHVLLSSIIPCALTRGHYETFVTGQQAIFDRQRPVKFPSWLGQNSAAGKNKRLLRCLTFQAMGHSKGISGTQEDVLLDYIPRAWESRLTDPLAQRGKDAIPEVIAFMDQYHIMRDDWEFIQSVAHFKKMQSASPNPAAGDIPGGIKAAFTREFNKTHRLESFAKGALQRVATDGIGFGEGEEDNEEEGSVAGASRPTAKKASAKTAAKPKKAAKKEGNENAKPKKAAAKTAKPAGRRGRKATLVDSDSEPEFESYSSDDY
ncbi:replication factor C, subunit 1, putative [Trypanosoma equiperdum]|uniref:Replication factor C, subunit 1, putative n=4 Tax=Trypanozoon TaxID=39700 RepID=Q385K3_TRYB2|nr:replication factor C large subunit, putative [Trypanosoma brucei gambiense DAL972]XP_828640.1 replication factor C subunit 1 [Trypanosoma brucei brucei TREU927]RHW67181.1 replication factor C [Trypanosoma brucei equiperdum]SCU66346.1 replication factor C, subunit 1, putative [Trypanosoma equiperdum]EAN79528.1 replication factor C, subunit 1, putative [Trypanosoma brucei brucei TREU927]CBH17519.1 replication factor C large subunit, putative [Trypanosoma brucei gambiense DAL972]|eukprot:XP_011779783.1 replication factor C large subunit, putative [Trypanosoma brucei gambiense DAL972]